MEQKNLEYYLNLPYKIEVLRDYDPENPGWVATIPDLPGCITQVDSFEELENMIEDAKQTWLEAAIERGIPIPEPRAEEEYSGKFVVRVPRSLHRNLVEEAEREGASLNQYINLVLASAKSRSYDKTIDQISELFDALHKFLSISTLEDSEMLAQRLFYAKIEHNLVKIHQSVDERNAYAVNQYFDKLITELNNLPNRQPIIDLVITLLRSWRNDLNRLTSQIRQLPPQVFEIKSEENVQVAPKYSHFEQMREEELESETLRNLFGGDNIKIGHYDE